MFYHTCHMKKSLLKIFFLNSLNLKQILYKINLEKNTGLRRKQGYFKQTNQDLESIFV